MIITHVKKTKMANQNKQSEGSRKAEIQMNFSCRQKLDYVDERSDLRLLPPLGFPLSEILIDIIIIILLLYNFFQIFFYHIYCRFLLDYYDVFGCILFLWSSNIFFLFMYLFILFFWTVYSCIYRFAFLFFNWPSIWKQLQSWNGKIHSCPWIED